MLSMMSYSELNMISQPIASDLISVLPPTHTHVTDTVLWRFNFGLYDTRDFVLHPSPTIKTHTNTQVLSSIFTLLYPQWDHIQFLLWNIEPNKRLALEGTRWDITKYRRGCLKWVTAVASKVRPVYWLIELTYGANLYWKQTQNRTPGRPFNRAVIVKHYFNLAEKYRNWYEQRSFSICWTKC